MKYLKYIVLILAIGLLFGSCKKDEVNPNCWLVVSTFGWTELPSNRTVVEITMTKDGVTKTIRKKGYKVGDYYCD